MPESPPSGRGRGRPRRLGADEEILTVALAVLREQGYHDLTVDTVAERAGVAKTTIYRRWPSKGALVTAALTPLAAAHQGPPEDGRGLDAGLAFILHQALAFLRVAGDTANEPEMAEAMRGALSPDRERLAALLTRHAVPGDPALLADLLLGALLFGRQEVEAIVRTVLHGALGVGGRGSNRSSS
jgi:AcrR family transcriptional regulator